jgi:hypothetical protein
MLELAFLSVIVAAFCIGYLEGRLSTRSKPDDVDPVSDTSTPPDPYPGRTYAEGPRLPSHLRKRVW